ncbi:MAG: hypothetical protein LBU27_06480 [Candidatus Peribacteria bacterium]|jgi:small nuclear ribonucleoprotein (snRNP)-like protein|nr:hypothetical protein [Candidatus Peribacteria bacterium]
MSTESSAGQLLGNEANAKQQYFSSVNLNQASLINTAKQRAEELCRGKWGTEVGEIYCVDRASRTYNVSVIKDKIVIVRKGNITLKGEMTSSSNPLNIFIDGGRLILDMSGQVQSFDKNGYPTVSDAVYTGIYLKGNFIINGIMVGNDNKPVENQTFIHGKFTSLNTYAEPSQQRQTQLNHLLNPEPTTGEIDLREVFSRRCEWGMTTDGFGACPTTGDFTNSPLIIINQNYPSKLVQ